MAVATTSVTPTLRESRRGRTVRGLLAATLLTATVAFSNWWPTPGVWWNAALSVEVGVLVVVLSVLSRAGRTTTPLATRTMVGLWLLLALGRYIQVTAPALWGRELNLYWDLQFLPDVLSMLAAAASPALVAASIVSALTIGALLWLALHWSVRALGRWCEVAPNIALSLGVALLTLFTVDRLVPSAPVGSTGDGTVTRRAWFADPVVHAYARQVGFLLDARWGTHDLPPSPAFSQHIDRASAPDVLLVFSESYGAVAFDNPAFAAALSRSREAFESAATAQGRHVVSAFVTSPTFGGSSWYAHVTLLSGLTVSDPDMNARLLTERRDTWPSFMARNGYRSIALMPGLWSAWPEGRFYGFDEVYDGNSLDYKGPPFGWWMMPDQYSLAQLDALEMNRTPRAPLFVFFPTVSTHTPFTPAPPYQPDWTRMRTLQPFDDKVLETTYDDVPDWSDLGPSYVKAVSYSYTMLAGYLTQHASQDFVLIVIGDHQPPALVTGAGAPWDVPVHVVSSRPAVIERLEAAGFRAGLTPARPTLGGMASLLPIVLDALSAR